MAATGIFAEHPVQNSLRAIYAAELIDKSRVLKLSESRAWLRLAHYDKFLGNVRSEARDKTPGEFFVHPNGETDPQAELEASVTAILTDVSSPEPARCRFPAREIFLIQHLGLDAKRLPAIDCPKYKDWRNHLNPDAVSIVFASFFMGNPSSMFGHTFLRFHNRNKNALLDGSFNYAANAGEENAIVYAWRGMTGGFPGTYAMHPYYVKINEYNDMESRDLWEFELKLSTQEMDFLLAHLWEMSSVYFPYFYLDENCSYQLLTLLEAVRPETKLTHGYSLYVTPTDTLHTLSENNFFTGDAKYRAAVFTRYMIFYENAAPSARAIFKKIMTARALPEESSSDHVVAADMLLEYYRYANDYDAQKWPPATFAHYQDLLKWRALHPIETGLEQKVVGDPEKNPLAGFKSSNIFAGYSNSTLGDSILIGIRPALREIHDASRGFSPWSQIQIMGGSLSYIAQKNTLRVEEFYVADILALAPWQANVSKFSYRLRTGLYRHDVLDYLGTSTLSWDSTAGGGITLLPFSFVGWFIFAQATAQVAPLWENTLRIAPSLMTGLKFNWSNEIATSLIYEIDYGLISNAYAMQKIEIKNGVALTKYLALEISALAARASTLQGSQDFYRVNGHAKYYF